MGTDDVTAHGDRPKPLAVLSGDRIALRPLEERDLPQTLEWRNANREWFIHDQVISEEGHRAWFARYAADPGDIVFVMSEHRRPDRPIGQIALYRIDLEAGRAECGRLIVRDDARGNGLASDAIRLLVRWAFESVGISEIVADILEHNAASRRSFERAGFVWRSQHDGLITLVARAPAAIDRARR